MHTVVTQARAADAPWIAAIWNQIIADTLVTFTTTPKAEDDIGRMIDSAPVFVLPDRAGFATYGPFRGGPGYAATAEHTIYLARGAQGQGMGAALMTRLMDHARQSGIRAMVAGISGANAGAVRFHARLGFGTVGTMPGVGYKHGQWLDLILMQKMLNPTDSPGGAG